MTALEKQMAEALRKRMCSEAVCKQGETCCMPDAKEALAQFDAQAAEQAAGGAMSRTPRTDAALAADSESGGTKQIERLCRELEQGNEQAAGGWEAVPVSAESRFKGEHKWSWCDVAHARMVLAKPHEWPGYEARLLYTHPAPAAPSDPWPKGKPDGWLVYLPSEQRQEFYDSQDDPGYMDDVTNHPDAVVTPYYLHPLPAPAPAESPAASAQRVSARPSADWYRNMIRETEGLDETLPCGALSTRPELSDAERWRMQVALDAEFMKPPAARTLQASLAALYEARVNGLTREAAIDAALAAARGEKR